MSWSRESATLVYERGRGDAVRSGAAFSYWTTAAHHAGIIHLASFAFESEAARTRKAGRTPGDPLADDQVIEFYNATKAARVNPNGFTGREGHGPSQHPLAGEAFTQAAHAERLRQLWDIATDIGAGEEPQ